MIPLAIPIEKKMTSFMMASCLTLTGTRCSSLQPRPQHSFRFELCTSDRLRLWTLWLKIQSHVLEVYLLLLLVLHLPRKFANQECLPWQIELLWVVIPLLIKNYPGILSAVTGLKDRLCSPGAFCLMKSCLLWSHLLSPKDTAPFTSETSVSVFLILVSPR